MIRYAQSTRCRLQLLLEYFGEKTPPCAVAAITASTTATTPPLSEPAIWRCP